MKLKGTKCLQYLFLKGCFSVFIGTLFLSVLLGCSQNHFSEQDLQKGFKDPDKEYRPRAYWNWLNGDVTLNGLTRDLEEAKDKGLGGLLIWDTEAMRNPGGMVPAGPPFLGEQSLEAIRHCMKEAERLDLELGMVCASGWNSGGAWIPPELAGKNLFFSSVDVNGPGELKMKLPFPEVPERCPKGEDGMPLWYYDVAVLAWPASEKKMIGSTDKVLDLSDNYKNGELDWSPPDGKWKVVRFVCSNNGQQLIAASPNSKGLFIDFLDPEATRFHFEYIINKLGLEKGDQPGTPLKSLDDDSMELHHGIQWTTKFRDWFKKHHSYDPVSWLPVLMGWTIEDNEVSERFLYDYKKTVSDLLIFSHYKTGTEICAEYGIHRTAEAGGPGPPFWESCPVDALKALGNVSIPRGEFWMGNPRNLFLIKEIASAAHIYGKPYVDAESWTTWRRWRDSPFERKKLVDRAFCEGLNRITYHGYSHSPVENEYPGRTYHAGVDMNPQVVWWSKARPFMDYLARCCYMLQQGLYVADVAYYYGDQAPNFWPYYHNVPEKPGINGLGRGYEYDVVNTDVILNRMEVKDGRIIMPDGMSYRILVLPEKEDIPLEVLTKIEKLVAAGATVIGPKPDHVPGKSDYEQKNEALRELADKMWGDCDGHKVKVNNYGKGKIVWGHTPQQWLEQVSIGPDFKSVNSSMSSKMDFIHRQTEKHDIYFVSNKTSSRLKTECIFRVKDRQAQYWCPETGTIKNALVCSSTADGTRLPIVLPPGGSIFVVFEKGVSGNSFVSFENTEDNRNETIPHARLFEQDNNSISLQCWQNGQYTLCMRNGQQKNIEVTDIPEPISIKGDWKVEFDPDWGAPAEISLPELISWTDHSEDGVKYYSGKGSYYKTIEVPEDWIEANRSVHIELGDVRDVAEVFVNGKSAGILWKPPYRTELTKHLKPGTNELNIEVMNLWINRLAGDKQLREDERFTSTNIEADGGSWLENWTEWTVQPAGMLGPVSLLPSTTIAIK